MPLEIPTDPTSRLYRQTVQLDGVNYGFTFRWNQREGSWYFDLFAGDGSPLRYGVKVLVGFPLAARVRDVRKPPGRIVAIDTSGGDAPPGAADLGDRVRLIYVSQAEVLAGAAS